ncbi:Hypothetical protein FKW44_024016, partial [Caligus rogercresseyi]
AFWNGLPRMTSSISTLADREGHSAKVYSSGVPKDTSDLLSLSITGDTQGTGSQYLQPKSVEWLVMEVFLLPGRPWQCVKTPSVESCGSP